MNAIFEKFQNPRLKSRHFPQAPGITWGLMIFFQKNFVCSLQETLWHDACLKNITVIYMTPHFGKICKRILPPEKLKICFLIDEKNASRADHQMTGRPDLGCHFCQLIDS